MAFSVSSADNLAAWEVSWAAPPFGSNVGRKSCPTAKCVLSWKEEMAWLGKRPSTFHHHPWQTLSRKQCSTGNTLWVVLACQAWFLWVSAFNHPLFPRQLGNRHLFLYRNDMLSKLDNNPVLLSSFAQQLVNFNSLRMQITARKGIQNAFLREENGKLEKHVCMGEQSFLSDAKCARPEPQILCVYCRGDLRVGGSTSWP